MLLTDTFSPIISNLEAVNEATFHLAPNEGDGLGDYDPTGPDGALLIGETVTSSGSGEVGSMFWGGYAGTGTFTIQANASQVGSLSFNSGIETASTPVLANGSITVTYEFIPEPSVALLAGIAGLGMAFRRRRG